MTLKRKSLKKRALAWLLSAAAMAAPGELDGSGNFGSLSSSSYKEEATVDVAYGDVNRETAIITYHKKALMPRRSTRFFSWMWQSRDGRPKRRFKQ